MAKKTTPATPAKKAKGAPGRKVKPGLLYRAKTVAEEAEKKARHQATEKRRRAEQKAEGEARRRGETIPLKREGPSVPMETPKRGEKGYFGKGNSGRPKGARDRLPRTIKASVKQLIEEVVLNEQKTLRKALINGLKSSSRFADKYLRICAEYTDGTPEQSLKLSGFNPDELENVGTALSKKMEALTAAVLAKKARKT